MHLLQSAWLLAILCVSTFAYGANLSQTVNALGAQSGLRSGSYGVAVVDCDGRLRAGIDAHTARIPASNMKLLSSGTAIATLGPKHLFRTRLLRDGDDIVLVGDGDPALADPELFPDMKDAHGRAMTADGVLDIWAEAIEQAGMSSVNRLVIDDRIFDQQFTHPSWPANQLSRHYCAGSAGLNFHRNMLHLRPEPGQGQPRLDDVRPAVPFMPIENRLKSHRTKTEVSATRTNGGDSIVVSGTIAQKIVEPIAVTVHDMPLLTGRMLADRLTRRGIEVAMVTRPNTGEQFNLASPLGPDIVTPIARVLERCNVDSCNIYADALLKRSAHEATKQPGSWRDGAALVRREVHARTGTNKVEIADGSGMSQENKVSPFVLATWLASFDRGTPEGDALLGSLSTLQKGTLKRRFESLKLSGCTLAAKTGYISGASTLSGVITAPDGQCAAFSVLCNNLQTTTSAKALQRDVIEAVAKWLVRNPPARRAAA